MKDMHVGPSLTMRKLRLRQRKRLPQGRTAGEVSEPDSGVYAVRIPRRSLSLIWGLPHQPDSCRLLFTWQSGMVALLKTPTLPVSLWLFTQMAPCDP